MGERLAFILDFDSTYQLHTTSHGTPWNTVFLDRTLPLRLPRSAFVHIFQSTSFYFVAAVYNRNKLRPDGRWLPDRDTYLETWLILTRCPTAFSVGNGFDSGCPCSKIADPEWPFGVAPESLAARVDTLGKIESGVCRVSAAIS